MQSQNFGKKTQENEFQCSQENSKQLVAVQRKTEQKLREENVFLSSEKPMVNICLIDST